MKKKVFSVQAVILLAALAALQARAVEIEGYGSLRIGTEYVNPDNLPGNFGSYSALRDAYSRVGVKVTHDLNQDWSLMGQLELPLDLVNLDIQSAYDNNDNTRIGKLQVTGPMGMLWYGRGWMAYYNHIAYPVDYFSSYYSGWATLTTFRREDTLYYATPRLHGFQAAFATTKDNGTSSERREQFVLSYAKDGLSLTIGRDDPNGGGDAITGISASYTTGPWYLAAKHEEFSGAKDGQSAQNLLVQYALDNKNTLRAMIADVDVPAWGGYGDKVFHIGWDHQYRADLKFFVEYYSEQSTAAISDARTATLGSGGFYSAADSGGSAFTLGLRYDFSGKIGSR